MKFISFLNDLGIIPNKGTCYEKNPSLNQGQEFMDFNRMHNRNEGKKIGALQVTTIPGVTSIVENMENMTSSETSKKDLISKLEEEFNRTLAEYQVVYKQFNEDMIKINADDKEIKKYFGEVITSGDGNYSYVNDYGYTHKYSNDAWSSNAENCPVDPMTISKSLMSKFQKGNDMGKGQACAVAGKNIQNKDTQEYAWVDIKGKKHIYSSNLWKKKNKSCNIPAISLSAEEYNAIPSGGNMTEAKQCNRLKANPEIMKKMHELNKKMEKLAKEMLYQMDNLDIEDANINMAMNEERAKLNNYINQISKDNSQLNFYNQDKITVYAEEEDSYLREKSTRMHYVAWCLLFLTIFALLLHTYINPSSNVTDNVVVVIGLVFIFVVCKAIYNKYYYRL